jgi:hypothetical protein
MKYRFYSQRDTWLIFVLVFIIISSATACLMVMLAALPIVLKLGLVLVCLASGCALPIWTLMSTYYEIDNTYLLVRCGPFTWQILRSHIESIQPSESPISGPALSLNRLLIRYKPNQTLVISPLDPQQFTQRLMPDA